MAEPFDERRESQRVPCRFQVREAAVGGSFVPLEGNLALGGIYYTALHPPVGAKVEVRFLLPGQRGEREARREASRPDGLEEARHRQLRLERDVGEAQVGAELLALPGDAHHLAEGHDLLGWPGSRKRTSTTAPTGGWSPV